MSIHDRGRKKLLFKVKKKKKCENLNELKILSLLIDVIGKCAKKVNKVEFDQLTLTTCSKYMYNTNLFITKQTQKGNCWKNSIHNIKSFFSKKGQLDTFCSLLNQCT